MRASPAANRQTEPQVDSQPPRISAQEPKLRFRAPEVTIRVSHPEREPARAGTRSTAPALTWHSANQPISVAGLPLTSGMIYSAERALRWPGEPSAIITSLSVARHAAHPLQEFGYYPSYENLSAEQRRCYLEWINSGRADASPAERTLGYIFIFFYGLERRILIDGDRDPALLEELIRLLQHYGPAHKSRSLKSYGLQLLHFGGWQLGSDAYRGLWPRLLECDGERADPDGLRFVLANLYQRAEPMDWTVAYRVALASEESRRSTVVTRAREKFWQLFEQRFLDQFPGGLKLQASKQQALLQYRPASSALLQMSDERRGPHPLEYRLPNVSGLHRQFKSLPAIWNSCVDDLSGYSRAIGGKKQGQAAAVAAWLALPTELRRAEAHPLQGAFDEMLASAPWEGDYAFVSAGTLASLGISASARNSLRRSPGWSPISSAALDGS